MNTVKLLLFLLFLSFSALSGQETAEVPGDTLPVDNAPAASETLPLDNAPASGETPAQAETEKPLEEPAEPPADFRNVRWGMSQEQVLEKEARLPLVENNNSLVYQDSLLGFPCLLHYHFHDNRLYTASYAFPEKYIYPVSLPEIGRQLLKTLAQKYGTPLLEEGRLAEDDTRLLQRLKDGTASFLAVWKTPQAAVQLKLSGKNLAFSGRGIALTLSYFSALALSQPAAADDDKL